MTCQQLSSGQRNMSYSMMLYIILLGKIIVGNEWF